MKAASPIVSNYISDMVQETKPNQRGLFVSFTFCLCLPFTPLQEHQMKTILAVMYALMHDVIIHAVMLREQYSS